MTTVVQTVEAGQPYKDSSARYSKSSGKNSLLKPTKSGQSCVSKIKIDPLRALEPARKKLCMLESQRVMSVFDDTIKRAEIITLLPYIVDNLERFNIALGQDLMLLLTNHKHIMKSYEEIRDQLNKINVTRPDSVSSVATEKLSRESTVMSRDGPAGDDVHDQGGENDEIEKEIELLTPGSTQEVQRDDSDFTHKPKKSLSATSPLGMVMKQLSLVAEQLSNSCKNVLRAFSTNHEAINAVHAEYRKRSEQCDQFCVSLNELREILFNKLLTTPIEAREKMDYLEEIALRERQNNLTIAKLEADLNANNEEKDEEIKKRNEVIRKLQGDLHQIERLSDENIRRMKADAEKQEITDTKNSDGRQQKLQNDMGYNKGQLQTLRDEHKEQESNMRKKKFRVETEVDNWIQKYDQDMGERQDEYEEIDAIYTEEKKQLHELEERFKTLEEEYTKILEERKREREEREKAEREMHIMVRCATTIQAFWRSFKVRKMLKAKKKGKGKGKGKGKKK